MDPLNSIKDDIRCHLCDTNKVQSYCDFCCVNLCMRCIGSHISDEYDDHKIVPIQQRRSTVIYPRCTEHHHKTCELQCKHCNMFICTICSASEKHTLHDFIVLEQLYTKKRTEIEKDTKQLELYICPSYEDISDSLKNQIAILDGEYHRLTRIISNQGEEWHKEIDGVIARIKNELYEIKVKHLGVLEKHLNEIKDIELLIQENILDLKKLEESKNVSSIIEYRSTYKIFTKFPPKIHVTMPEMFTKSIQIDQIRNIKSFDTSTDIYGYTIKRADGSQKEFFESPMVIKIFNTECKYIRGVSVFNDDQIWTCAAVGEMKCFDSDGKCTNTIATISNRLASDIAVSLEGQLEYSDWKLKTAIKMCNGKIEEIIFLKGWTPINLCFATSGDLLVVFYNDEETLSKVVRYSRTSQKNTIQFDNDGKPLYSGNNKTKYITENKNFDVCVADSGAGAVVVVNFNGQFRFRYTGHSSENRKYPFTPYGITSDSQSHILTADFKNHCIHILNENGKFLLYIENVNSPWGLCVNKFDDLFVTEFNSAKIKIIKYLFLITKCNLFLLK